MEYRECSREMGRMRGSGELSDEFNDVGIDGNDADNGLLLVRREN